MKFLKKDLLFYSNLILNVFSVKGLRIIINKNQLNIIVLKQHLQLLLAFLKYNLQFNSLVDVFGLDLVYNKNRFIIVYNLISYKLNFRIIIKTSCNKFDKINSVINLFTSANWLERETFDMFGIFFENHTDLRRILTDYGFKGFPLRKDFPLIGYKQIRYDDIQNRLVYEPVTLTQKYRYFTFSSPWNLPIKQNIYKINI